MLSMMNARVSIRAPTRTYLHTPDLPLLRKGKSPSSNLRSPWLFARNLKKFASRSSATDTQLPKSFIQNLDELLNKAEQKQALDLVKKLTEEGQLQFFGKISGVPKRQYTLEELKLNRIDPVKLLSPTDASLNFVRKVAQVAALAGLGAVAAATDFDTGAILYTGLAVTFAVITDQVVNGGGGQSLLLDSLGRVINSEYRQRVAYHEAGHFLIAYLVGILPRTYTLSSWDALKTHRALNVQAGTLFCDDDFQAEVSSGRLSSSSLDRFTCVALAGVVTEAIRFEQAEGGLNDIAQLDQLLKALGFTQKKAADEIRWAVLNTATLLKRHSKIHDKLAKAMDEGKSTASCIALMEEELRRSSWA